MSQRLKMTPVRARLLLFIIRYIGKHAVPPSTQEMMRQLRVKATNAVGEQLWKLERDGFVKRDLSSGGQRRGSRALKVVAWPCGTPYDLTRGRADELRAELPGEVEVEVAASGHVAKLRLVRVL